MRIILMPDQFGTHHFLRSICQSLVTASLKMDLFKDDLLLFEGGTDVAPHLYKENIGKYTQGSDHWRDNFEVAMWKKAQSVGAGSLGICRGSQLLTVLSGGKLIQHVTHHGGDHKILTNDGKTVTVSSTHHQMMAPLNSSHVLVGWAEPSRSAVYLNGDNEHDPSVLNQDIGLEPEIVWYPDTRSLAIQGHPEYMSDEHEFPVYSRKILQHYILNHN